MRHKFAEIKLESGTPIDFNGRRIQAIISCIICREAWVISYDIPMAAVRVLQPDASKERIDNFFRIFEKLLESKAKDFVAYHSLEESDPDTYPPPKECKGKMGV